MDQFHLVNHLKASNGGLRSHVDNWVRFPKVTRNTQHSTCRFTTKILE